MRKDFLRNFIYVVIISSLFFLIFNFVKNYNSSENIEGRCTNKFNEDFERGIGMSEEEWSQNMDLAEEKFFECMKIP